VCIYAHLFVYVDSPSYIIYSSHFHRVISPLSRFPLSQPVSSVTEGGDAPVLGRINPHILRGGDLDLGGIE